MLWLERLRKVFLTGDTMPAYRSAGEDAPNRKMRKDKIVIHLSSPLLNGRGDVLLYEKERPLWKLWKRGWPSLPSSSGMARRSRR